MRPPYVIRRQSNGYIAAIPRPRGAGRVRKWFKTEPEAVLWADANFSAIRAADITPLTPAETAEYRAARSLLDDDASLIDAAKAYARANRTARPLDAAAAVDLYIQSRRDANLRPISIHNATRYLRRLAGLGNLGRLTTADLEAMLVGMSPHSRNQVIAHYKAFFSWLDRRGMLAVNPAAGLEMARIDFKAPAIYTPAQAAAILAAAEESDQAIVAHLALAAFAGIRSSGLLRLPTAAVNLEAGTVLVPGAADKLRRSYLITINSVPNMLAWLTAYPYAKTGLSLRRINARILKVYKKAGVKLVRNGFRHSFGSYFYALTSDPIRTSAMLGHFGGVDTLLGHYRALATRSQAEEYFSIWPQLGKAKSAVRVTI